MSKTCILPGTNSKLLAEAIAQKAGLPYLNSRVVHFINSEMKIKLPDEIVNYESCIIVQSTSNPANNNLMEILLLADTLKLEGIQNISAIIPYFGYARQDKQHLPKECISITTISKILQAVGIQRVLTADIHSEKILKNINLKIKNISVLSEVAKQVYQDLGLSKNTESAITIASPDDGGIDRAKLFAENFYQDQANGDFVSIKKTRHLNKEHYCEAVELRGEIKDKKVILIDDISTSGGTILNALELCKANKVAEVYAVIVHADFARGVAEKFQNSDLKGIYTTNTIEKTIENLEYYKKIKVLDVSKSFVRSI